MNVKNILVPTDFSPSSEAALSRACTFARSFEAQLHLIHVVSGEFDGDANRRTLEKLGRAIEPHFELNLDVRKESLAGVAYKQITDYARKHDVDLIVMGTQGRTGLDHLVMGSVAERVLRSAPCPVLVVKPDEDEEVPFESQPIEVETDDTGGASAALDLVQRAMSLRATDIHLDPRTAGDYSVRFRIDGQLEKYCDLDHAVADHLIQQLKLQANLDIAEPFRPKEGRLQLQSSLSDLEVRITTSPVTGGEAVALRLFSRADVFYPLDRLGLSDDALASVQKMLRQGEGIVLVTGPTGAGKTTTVYSMLEILGTGNRNVVSIEDPVEFDAEFVRQMSVDERHGISMSSGLRTLLRMDPDIIFVGEIRDREAADVGMRAASSGRHVFSTLHTRDVAATVTALRDLHIDNRSMAGNLTGIVNQRLLRRLCQKCVQHKPITNEQRSFFVEHGLEAPTELCEAAGCDECRGTGFYGRVGVFETAVADDSFSEAIARSATEEELRQLIRSAGTFSLTSDALCKVRDGITSFEEAVTMRWL